MVRYYGTQAATFVTSLLQQTRLFLVFWRWEGGFFTDVSFFFQCRMQLLAAFETAKTVASLYNRNAQVENLPPSSFATKTEMTEYPRPIWKWIKRRSFHCSSSSIICGNILKNDNKIVHIAIMMFATRNQTTVHAPLQAAFYIVLRPYFHWSFITIKLTHSMKINRGWLIFWVVCNGWFGCNFREDSLLI